MKVQSCYEIQLLKYILISLALLFSYEMILQFRCNITPYRITLTTLTMFKPI